MPLIKNELFALNMDGIVPVVLENKHQYGCFILHYLSIQTN